MLNQSIPLVPWNEEQWQLLNLQPFILLLHKLGFHLPSDTGKLFVRIPNFWTADYMFSIAQRLGPINTGINEITIITFNYCFHFFTKISLKYIT